MEVNEEQHVNISSRKRRIAAFIVDFFLMLLLMTPIFIPILYPNVTDVNSMDTMVILTTMYKMIIAMLIFMLLGPFLYFSKDSIKGISIGKWIMGIMVRDAQNPNDVPSFVRLFIRNLFLIIWFVEFIVLTSSQEKKRLGDKIAQTIVVKNPNRPKKLPRILVLVGLGFAFFQFIFSFGFAIILGLIGVMI